MAIYEFKCTSCRKLTIRGLSITSKQVKIKCDYCDGVAERIISKSNFALKGGGWGSSGYSKGGK